MTDKFYIKVLVLGESGVGKTNYVNRFTKKHFDEEYITTVAYDIVDIKFVKDEKKYPVEIYDVAGHKRIFGISRTFMEGSHGYIVMSDATKPETRQK